MTKLATVLGARGSSLKTVIAPIRDRIEGNRDAWILDRNNIFVAADVDGDGVDELIVRGSKLVPSGLLPVGPAFMKEHRIGVIKIETNATGERTFRLVWTGVKSIGAWVMHPSDEYYVGDFDGDDSQELVVRRSGKRIGLLKWSLDRLRLISLQEDHIGAINDGVRRWTLKGSDRYVVARIASGQQGRLLDSLVVRHKGDRVGVVMLDGTRLLLRWRQDRFIDGVTGTRWRMNSSDKYEVADIDGDSQDELLVHKGSDRLGVIKWNVDRLTLVDVHLDEVTNSRGSQSWPLNKADRYFHGNLYRDLGRTQSDLIVTKGNDRIGVMEWRANRLVLRWRQNDRIAHRHGGDPWPLSKHDELFPGQYVDRFSPAIAIRNGGNGIGVVKWSQSRERLELRLHEDDQIPHPNGWKLRSKDRFTLGRFTGSDKDELFVFYADSKKNFFQKIVSFFGNIVRSVLRLIPRLINAVIAVLPRFACALGIRGRQKVIEVRVRILRDETGRPLIPNADAVASLEPFLNMLNNIFETRVNVTVKDVPNSIPALIRTLNDAAPASALDPHCQVRGFWDSLVGERRYFQERIDHGKGPLQRFLLRGRAVTVFIVREVQGGSRACASSLTRDYVFLDLEHINNPRTSISTPLGDDDEPTVLAHEIGHVCGLAHVNAGENLMNNDNQNTTLTRRQICKIRSSRHVVYKRILG